jgi:hypothetical protein
MGREVECLCQYGPKSATVKALLETHELILRSRAGGEIRHRIPFSEIQELNIKGAELTFTHQGEAVTLVLGNETASRWLHILQSPPVTLAKKLGITPDSIVWKLGKTNDPELEVALATARKIKRSHADPFNLHVTLVLALVNSKAELTSALEITSEQVRKGAPLWLIYPKGKGHAISESDVRSTALSTEIVDNKVASISSTLTGLRFVIRKAK